MNEKQIVKRIMRVKGCSQTTLAKEMGYKGQANITSLLNTSKNGMRTDILRQMLDILGYELIIRNKFDKREEFVVGETEDISTPKKLTKDEEIAMLREQLAKYQNGGQ